MTCLTKKKRGVSGSAADCPPLFFVYFVIVCALLPPDLFMQTAPRKYFRGAVTSAFVQTAYQTTLPVTIRK